MLWTSNRRSGKSFILYILSFVLYTGRRIDAQAEASSAEPHSRAFFILYTLYFLSREPHSRAFAHAGAWQGPSVGRKINADHRSTAACVILPTAPECPRVGRRRKVCKKLLYDTSATPAERKLRAEGLKRLGGLFIASVAPENAGDGPKKTFRRQGKQQAEPHPVHHRPQASPGW